MIRGLAVGKFAPLHLGHELLITTALAGCNELLIISYTSQKFVGCDAVHRRRWLQQRFPESRVVVLDDDTPVPDDNAPDNVQRAFVVTLLQELVFVPDRVFTSESYGLGFANYLAAAFSHSVEHVSVDPARVRIPVSATKIRANVHAHKHWLAPQVYASFIQRIAFLGAESTGKSTLGEWLAVTRATEYAAEYGREVWEANAGVLTFPDLLRIAKGQIEREELLAQSATGYLVCDTTPLTTLFYCLHYFGSADPELVRLAERKYEHYVLLWPDFPLVQDGTRQDEEFRKTQHQWYINALRERGIRAHNISGDIGARRRNLEEIFPELTLRNIA